MSIRGSWFAGSIAIVLFAAAGCEDKKAAPRPEGGDSGAAHAKSGGVDKNIVDAVRAEGSAVAQSGPPESGVFGPGGADHELPPGSPPKLAFGLTGSSPTVTLAAPKASSAKKLEGKIQVAVQTGPRSAMPTVELALSAEAADKPPDSPPGPTEVIVKAISSKLAAEQPGALPPGADKLIAKAKGSRIKIEVLPAGAGHVTAIEPAKDLDESLAMLVRAAADSVEFAFQQYPTERIGAGGFWMLTSRENYAGLDAVVYRMYKVQEVKPDRVELEVSVKRFVNPGSLSLPGLPPNKVDEFVSNTTGHLEVMTADTSQIHAELTDTLQAALTPEGAAAAQAQGQHLQLQIQVRSRLAMSR